MNVIVLLHLMTRMGKFATDTITDTTELALAQTRATKSMVDQGEV